MRVLIVCLNEAGSPDSFVLLHKDKVTWAGRSDTVTSSFLDDFGSAEMTMNVNVRPWVNVVDSLMRKKSVGDPPRVVVVFRNRRFSTLREWTALYTALQKAASKDEVLDRADRAGAVSVWWSGALHEIRT